MKILIPIDGSDCSKATLDWATQTLDKNATLYLLLYVIKVIPEMPAEGYETEDALKTLKTAEEQLKQAGCRVEKAEYATGDPVEAICEYARSEKVDQVLLGSHGRTGLARFLLGSVSSGVLEKCPVPVFVYRNIEKQGADHGLVKASRKDMI